jgi:hypothetical protein
MNFRREVVVFRGNFLRLRFKGKPVAQNTILRHFNNHRRFFVPGNMPEPSHHFWGCDAHKRQRKADGLYKEGGENTSYVCHVFDRRQRTTDRGIILRLSSLVLCRLFAV